MRKPPRWGPCGQRLVPPPKSCSCYQPKVLLGTGRITEVETLVYWEHPERGLLSTGEFILVAEETGTILPLSRGGRAARPLKGFRRRKNAQLLGSKGEVKIRLNATTTLHPALTAGEAVGRVDRHYSSILFNGYVWWGKESI